MNTLPPVTPDELKTLVLAWEEGVPTNLAIPLIKKGLLTRQPPHFVLTETGRALLMSHALYQPYLVQSRLAAHWADCGRSWTQAGAMVLYVRLSAVMRGADFRVLDEDRRIVFTTENYKITQE